MIKVNGQSFDSAADGTNSLEVDTIIVKGIQGLESVAGDWEAPQGETGLQGVTGLAGADGEDGAGVVDSVLTLDETTTPVAVESKGKLYTKDDNCLYFQDGAGVEHKLAFDIIE